MSINLHSLSAESMLSHSRRWLANKEVRDLLESHPLGKTAMGEIEGAHEFLTETLVTWQSLNAMVTSLSNAIIAEDNEHDRFARALYGFLSALAESVDSPDEAEKYLEARAMMFPWGLSITQRSYAEEHQAVLEVDRRLTPPIRVLMDETRIGNGTLTDIYDKWIIAGKRLGAQVRERARLEASMVQRGGAELIPRLHDARTSWARAVRVLLSVLDVLPLESTVRERILTPLTRDVDDSVRVQALTRHRTEESGPNMSMMRGEMFFTDTEPDTGKD